MAISEEKKDELQEITEKFFPQHDPMQCEITCITNSLNHLFRSTGRSNGNHYRLRDISRICGWRAGAPAPMKVVIPAMKRELKPYGFTWEDRMLTKKDYPILITNANDDHCSFPIVSVAPDYFKHHEVTRRGRNQNDHAILILYAGEDELFIHDPDKIRIEMVGGVYKNTISTVSFLRYWLNAYFPGRTSWAEPIGGVNQTNLGQFQKSRGAGE